MTGADGNLWFVDSGHRKVGRITPAGAVTEFDLPAAAGDPAEITSGPGGVWVTTSGGGQGRPDWIVRIGVDGSTTMFQAGTNPGQGFGTGPESIAAGPDGNLWFTEFWANRIGRMSPAGVLTEFPIPTPDSAPRGIVAGSDGNVWFVESSRWHNAIARVTLAGVITEYPFGETPNDDYPGAIVAGPDGHLWFAKSNLSAPQGEIARASVSGVITTFPLPKGSRASRIANGPDGNLWFTDGATNTIGRMSLAGVIRQFALARRNAQPNGIITGPDNRMWFAEGSWIASIGITVPEAKLSSPLLRFNNGTPKVQVVDVTNPGEADLKVASVAVVGSDRDAFAMTKDGCTGRALPTKTTCRVEVSFSAGSDVGVRAARLVMSDNATGSPHAVSLVAQLPDCKFPLSATTPDSRSSQGQFLSLRDGVVVDDPSGRYVIASSTRLSQSQKSPTLAGYGPLTYVRAAKRWVPTNESGISPDGSRYAYIEYPQPFEGKLHVVDIATGRDRTLPMERGPWGLLAFTGDAIYLHQSYEGIGPGAMVVNPESGAVLGTILRDTAVHLISGQVAWTAWRNPADTMPEPPGIGGGSNEVQSRDLTASQKTVWLYRPGANLWVMAASNGSIVVGGADVTSNFVLVVTAPGQAVPVTGPDTSEPINLSGGPFADPTYGWWWFGSSDGLYLWTPRTGAFLVSESTAAPAGTCA